MINKLKKLNPYQWGLHVGRSGLPRHSLIWTDRFNAIAYIHGFMVGRKERETGGNN